MLKPPGLWERGMRKERFPTQARVNTEDLDWSKDLSMVLELYCRKAGGKREGRKTETGHGHVERGGKGKREREIGRAHV